MERLNNKKKEIERSDCSICEHSNVRSVETDPFVYSVHCTLYDHSLGCFVLLLFVVVRVLVE